MPGRFKGAAKRRPYKGRLYHPKFHRLIKGAAVLASVAVLATLAFVLFLPPSVTNDPSGDYQTAQDSLPTSTSSAEGQGPSLYGSTNRPKTAAIVDQLGFKTPNPDFVARTTNSLLQAGYSVDYFSEDKVTLDFYGSLPTLDYDLIILRVHGGISRGMDGATGELTDVGFVSLRTGERFTRDTHIEELNQGLVGWSSDYEDGSNPMFVIGPRFIDEKMKGRFKDTIIVMMGCDGLNTKVTAQAFLDKGAKAFISWSGYVSASHTDLSTEHLLEKLLTDDMTVGEAVAATVSEIGPDPWYGAELKVLFQQG